VNAFNNALSFFAAVLISTLATVSAAQSQTAVHIGGEPGADACGGWGKVKGLNPAGDGFLAVRSGPGVRNAMIDKIHNGQQIWFCDQKGSWIGIVYSQSKNTDCQVSSPIMPRKRYAGPCKSGWVHEKYVELTAG